MSGIFLAFWQKIPVAWTQRAAVCRDLLLHRVDSHQQFQVTFQDAACGETLNIHSYQTLKISFDGRLHNGSLLRSQLDLPDEATDSALIGALYLKYGDEFPVHLDGEFALAIMDYPRGRVILARDSMGICPLYYAFSADGLIASSLKKCILAALGIMPGADGLSASGIKSIGPAEQLVYENGLVHRWRYWDFKLDQLGQRPRRESYCEEFRNILTIAIQKRTREPATILVSGGLDSSCLWVLSQHAFAPEVCGLHYGLQGSDSANEENYVRELESYTRSEIERLPMESHLGAFTTALQDVWYGEFPAIDGLGHLAHKVYQTLAARNHHCVITGHWADQIFSPAIPSWRGVGNALRDQIIWKTIWSWMQPLQPMIYEAGLPPFNHEYQEHLYHEVRSVKHLDLLAWQNKIAAAHGVHITYPFFDRDVIQFLLGLPRGVAAQLLPDKMILRKAAGVWLPPKIQNRRTKGDYSLVVNRGLSNDMVALRHWLGERRRAEELGFLAPGTLSQALNHWDRRRLELLQGDPDAVKSWAVWDAVAFEMFARLYASAEKGWAEWQSTISMGQNLQPTSRSA